MAGGVFSGAKLNAMTIRESANDGSDFTNPDADYRRLFLGEDGFLHVKDSAGTVTDPYDTSGGGFTPHASSASTNTAQNLVTGAAVAIIDFEDVTFDADGAITTGAAWEYEAPVTGIYRVSAQVSLASAAGWVVGERLLVQLFLNGSVYRTLGHRSGAAGTTVMTANGSTLISLTAGDTIDVRATQNSGGDIALDGSALNNYIDIELVA